jgi:hypothetical protein
MGVGLTPPRLCSAIRPKGRGLRFDPGYHAKQQQPNGTLCKKPLAASVNV